MLPAFKKSDGKPRVVQVFECPVTDVRRPRHDDGRPRKAGANEPLSRAEEVAKQFRETLDSVKSFGVTHATGKERKKLEIERIVTLGGKAPKQQKRPYDQLMAMRKAAKKREEKHAELVKASGIVTGKKKTTAKVSKKRGDAGTMATQGRFKNGVLFVSKHDR
ncbi:hypothetical protein SDRG_02550 [Saprolegnia diclina VS20]|uniref:Uncharacterized protein n=1 Tax=Saprolegnia diclina (strain VS20) TaxID=1156394 RepID=T0S451_SAPDV|nr:hypothetical protein SDRG_02550 [Saprolegnia diclina VS20]EQC39893.1 hypothetical protein SDRG_02550 [Saprolegnia diclina VS20]|eukprot:XP_008606367.1 hypothetical protein SDRG_02550 [Saprolegnia diclina VS20]